MGTSEQTRSSLTRQLVTEPLLAKRALRRLVAMSGKHGPTCSNNVLKERPAEYECMRWERITTQRDRRSIGRDAAPQEMDERERHVHRDLEVAPVHQKSVQRNGA